VPAAAPAAAPAVVPAAVPVVVPVVVPVAAPAAVPAAAPAAEPAAAPARLRGGIGSFSGGCRRGGHGVVARDLLEPLAGTHEHVAHNNQRRVLLLEAQVSLGALKLFRQSIKNCTNQSVVWKQLGVLIIHGHRQPGSKEVAAQVG
jgi:hypothetical protein